ncbi:type II toxin-antitoxin system RelE/ParE family toxin [Patescibacteria group bacterium]|nr:type II toxin-antitoxin system RelE/ParE family toxin [Patescibacteria group bacterium]
MIIKRIYYSRKFIKELRVLPREIIALAVKKEKIFRENPLHPSLRLYRLCRKLEGLWSVSITGNYRIIFKRMPNGDVLFISVGKHDIYKYL